LINVLVKVLIIQEYRMKVLLILLNLSYFHTFVGPPEITDYRTGGDVPLGRSITLWCRARGLGTLAVSWERRSSGSRWITVNNAKAASYTTSRSLAIGLYLYRCRVSNEAGSVVSNSGTVIVYGKYQSARTRNIRLE